MALGMITVFVNVMTKGSIMEVKNQKTGKNDYNNNKDIFNKLTFFISNLLIR